MKLYLRKLLNYSPSSTIKKSPFRGINYLRYFIIFAITKFTITNARIAITSPTTAKTIVFFAFATFAASPPAVIYCTPPTIITRTATSPNIPKTTLITPNTVFINVSSFSATLQSASVSAVPLLSDPGGQFTTAETGRTTPKTDIITTANPESTIFIFCISSPIFICLNYITFHLSNQPPYAPSPLLNYSPRSTIKKSPFRGINYLRYFIIFAITKFTIANASSAITKPTTP